MLDRCKIGKSTSFGISHGFPFKNTLELLITPFFGVNKACAKFWWGSSSSKNKAHWLSWTKLCTSKDRGGLGLREIKLFNQDLLAKISWHILKYPNSLLAKVLKGRYIKGETFLNVPLGSNPSLTWRSILWRRELFKARYRWRIGNGRYVKIDQDPWIARQGSCLPLWVKDNLKGHFVASLLDNRGRWREDVIHDNFYISDIPDILNTISGGMNHQDEIIWNCDQKGIFSVKSAYHLTTLIQNSQKHSLLSRKKIITPFGKDSGS